MGVELFLFVCFSTPKVGDYFVFKSLKWVRFSWFFFFCFVFFVFVFCFVCLFYFFFVLCCFSFKMFDFPTIYLGSGWFFFLFLSRRLVKFFAFFHFCLFVFILLYFIYLFFFASKNSIPLDIKWCALILILSHRWWWTLRHRQFWIPVQFSEKSNSNLKLH